MIMLMILMTTDNMIITVIMIVTNKYISKQLEVIISNGIDLNVHAIQ